MNDEELRRRLGETLRAKAAQVPDPTGAFDPLAPVAELNIRRPKPARSAWRYSLVSAALIALVIGVTTVVLVSRSDDPGESLGPRTSVTRAAPTDAPSTTASTSTTTPTTITPTPKTAPVSPTSWTEHPHQLPDGTVPVGHFNAYLDAHPSPSGPKRLALTFARLDPPPTEPPNAVRVEEHPRERHATGDRVRPACRRLRGRGALRDVVRAAQRWNVATDVGIVVGTVPATSRAPAVHHRVLHLSAEFPVNLAAHDLRGRFIRRSCARGSWSRHHQHAENGYALERV